MKLRNKILIVVLVLVAVVGGGLFVFRGSVFGGGDVGDGVTQEEAAVEIEADVGEAVIEEPVEEEEVPAEPAPRDVLLDVPFAAQAPFRQWWDPVYQDACEEAAIIMAMRWVRGEGLTNQQMNNEVQEMSDWEVREYGSYVDRSAKDTAQLMRDYYGYEEVEARKDIGVSDIKRELFLGNLVIVPINGQVIGNPYYTQPGPERHMLVIIGYDLAKDEFITNDAGIGRGAGYRYSAEAVGGALRDYLTGDHEPFGKKRTAMIVVNK